MRSLLITSAIKPVPACNTLRAHRSHYTISVICCSATTSSFTPATPGTYHVTWSIGGVPSGCVGSFTVNSAGPPVTASCTITTSPSLVEPNVSFSYSLKLTYSGSNPPAGTAITGTNPFSLLPIVALASGGSSDTIASGSVPGGLPAGQYSGTYIVATIPPASGSCSTDIVGVPYFRTYGGDIRAGDGFGTGCSTSADPAIGGYTRNDFDSSKSYLAGSGTSLMAITNTHSTSGFIDGLVSGGLLSSAVGPPGSPKNLTVANTSAGPHNYGDDSGLSNCLTDYYAGHTRAGAAEPSGNFSADVQHTGTNKFFFSGPQSIGGASIPSAISSGAGNTGHNTIYIDGNLTITGDITYADSASWAAPGDIPSLRFIVLGNIYIDNNVSRLDGVYIAQRDSSTPGKDGVINDCSNGSAPYATSQLYANCNHQLKVFGAFIAKHVDLLRTYGSLKDAQNAEPYSNVTSSCNNSPGGSTNTCSGELFYYSPELSLTPDDSGTNTWQAITSLPPVL